MIRISKREQTRAFNPPPSGAFTNQIPLRERAIARCIFLEQSWIKPTEGESPQIKVQICVPFGNARKGVYTAPNCMPCRMVSHTALYPFIKGCQSAIPIKTDVAGLAFRVLLCKGHWHKRDLM